MEQQLDLVMTSLRSFMSDMGMFLPRMIVAVAILIVGILLYITRAWRYHDWPFRPAFPAPAEIKAS